jgi:hypothetical protein
VACSFVGIGVNFILIIREQTVGVCEQGAEEGEEVAGSWQKLHNEELRNLTLLHK